MSNLKKCIEFLKLNGWQTDNSEIVFTDDMDYMTFFKSNSIAVDIDESEIVFIGEQGDFLHLPVNYYTLIGALLECRQIGFNYKSVNNE